MAIGLRSYLKVGGYSAALIAVLLPIGWIYQRYVEPLIDTSPKAAFEISDEAITIENLNRSAWDDPLLILDDDAELRLRGRWQPGERRTITWKRFVRPDNNLPHNPKAKKGFTIHIIIPGPRSTVFYDWSIE